MIHSAGIHGSGATHPTPGAHGGDGILLIIMIIMVITPIIIMVHFITAETTMVIIKINSIGKEIGIPILQEEIWV